MALQPVIDAAWVRALPRERIANEAVMVRPLPGGTFPRAFSFTAAMRKMTGASYRRIVEQTESFEHEYLRSAQEGVVSVRESIVRVGEDTFDEHSLG